MSRVVRLRRPGLWAASGVVAVLVALVAVSVFRNPNIRHDVIAQYQFAPAILRGLELTIVLALLAAAIGIALGVVLAVMRVSSSPILRIASAGYTWLVRGTPLLVQILIWGNLALLFEHIGPFRTNDVLTPFVASVIALGLNEAAYMAEIVRGGILSVDRGQVDASLALGMSKALAMRRIILPQALRFAIPPTGNEFIAMLKDSALVSATGFVHEITWRAQKAGQPNFRSLEALLVAAVFYWGLTLVFSAFQSRLETFMARGDR